MGAGKSLPPTLKMKYIGTDSSDLTIRDNGGCIIVNEYKKREIKFYIPNQSASQYIMTCVIIHQDGLTIIEDTEGKKLILSGTFTIEDMKE